jgi:serine/threonine-protein kinase
VTEAADLRLFAPERWADVRRLVDRLDSLTTAERARELETLGRDDAELARIARVLLDQTQESVAEPLLLRAVDDLFGETRAAMPARIGPFRLLRRIGAGGMGVVYLAEREGADFTQRVALKRLETNVARMTRFASRERRILASLAHPNITAFVDAGSDETNTWLAMEYVDGETLVDYGQNHPLDLRGRVMLFDQVCAAVAHAHAQLVVHRDLKPSNVLVNSEGSAKLLDFGIAQILDATDERTPATRVFTPEYASPEQLRGDRATTSTDIYSLGLMLYELIAGKRLPTMGRPGDVDWTTSELARLATTQPEAATEAVTAPGTAKLVARQLRGDLGRIIAHAVAAEPAHRYASVLQLREDLTRWLEHRPLTIARRKFSYVAARFVRRNRVAVAVAAIALAGLIGLSVVALWQAQRARAMAERADRARSFLADMFASADPFSTKGGRTSVDRLRDGAQRIEEHFSDAPETQAELRATIASVLDRIGEPAQARDLMLRSVEQLRQVHGPRAPQVGVALTKLALAREDSGDLDGAHVDFTEAYAILRGTGAEYAKARIEAVTGLAKLANLRGDYADAERMHESVLKERQESEGPESADIAMDLMNLAADSLYSERYAQSADLANRAHAMLEHTVGPRHARNIYVDNVLGLAQGNAGDVNGGIATLRGAVDLARATLQPGALMIGNVIGSLGSVQLLAGDHAAAVVTLTEARTLNKASKNPRHGVTTMLLGLTLLRQQSSDALATLREAREIMAAQPSSNDIAYTTWGQAAYGAALAAAGDAAEGERLAREARATLLASPRAKSVRLGEIDALLAEILERKAGTDEARTLRAEALTTFQRVYGEEHPRTRVAAAQVATTDQRGTGN